jgi:hypothetical protein
MAVSTLACPMGWGVSVKGGFGGGGCGLAVRVDLRQAGSPPSETARMAILQKPAPPDSGQGDFGAEEAFG